MRKFVVILLVLLTLGTSSCTTKSALHDEVKKDFTKAMNAYNEIWKTKSIAEARSLAEKAFVNNEAINQVLEAHKANLEIDQGINITDKKYNISILNYNQNEATLKVKANLKGYPISIMSGQKKVTQKQDFSFGPHDYEMKKEQGTWKISKF